MWPHIWQPTHRGTSFFSGGSNSTTMFSYVLILYIFYCRLWALHLPQIKGRDFVVFLSHVVDADFAVVVFQFQLLFRLILWMSVSFWEQPWKFLFLAFGRCRIQLFSFSAFMRGRNFSLFFSCVLRFSLANNFIWQTFLTISSSNNCNGLVLDSTYEKLTKFWVPCEREMNLLSSIIRYILFAVALEERSINCSLSVDVSAVAGDVLLFLVDTSCHSLDAS